MRTCRITQIHLYCFGLFIFSASAFILEGCDQALGMKSGKILDKDISASSYHDLHNVGPQNARLETNVASGAWCPQIQDRSQYLQVKLNSVKALTAVATQGRFGNGDGQEYVSQYKIKYKRHGSLTWRTFSYRNGQKVIQGNNDTNTVVKRSLDPVILASVIRFAPVGVQPVTVCMRVELYGCDYTDGLLNYSIPDGIQSDLFGDFTDKSYDGSRSENYLSGGLGLLADGQSETKVDLELKPGRWMAWNKYDHPGGMEIFCEFDVKRIFRFLEIFCTTMGSKQLQAFSLVNVKFNKNKKDHMYPVSYKGNENQKETGVIVVPLQDHIGESLTVKLTFAAEWVAISELRFSSEVLNMDSAPEALTRNLHTTVKDHGEVPTYDSSSEDLTRNIHTTVTGNEDAPTYATPTVEEPMTEKKKYLMWIIIGAVLAIVVGSVIFLTVYFKHKAQKQYSTVNTDYRSYTSRGGVPEVRYVSANRRILPDDASLGNINNLDLHNYMRQRSVSPPPPPSEESPL